MNKLSNPIHCDYTLNILLFEESMLSYHKFLVVLNAFPYSFALTLTIFVQTETEKLEVRDKDVCEVIELKILSFKNLFLKMLS